MTPRELVVFALLAACAFAAWRIGEPKGINPWLCGSAGFALGPLFLMFLIFVPSRDGTAPNIGPAPWNDTHRAPAPQREVRYAAPPPPRDAS